MLGMLAGAEIKSIIIRPFVEMTPLNILTMFPLYICAILAVAIVINRIWALRAWKIFPSAEANRLMEMLRGGKTELAMQDCKGSRSLLSCVLGRGLEDLLKAGVPAEKALLENGARELASLSRGLDALNLITRVATQLGLFGTVVGMIFSFEQIAAQATPDKAMVAAGIATALITTALGLMIAIPTSVMESYLSRRGEAFFRQFEDFLGEAMNILTNKPAAHAVANK